MNCSRLTIDLDEPTANTLQDLTDFWGIAPQEAVVRAVQTAAQLLPARACRKDRLALFRQLQEAASVTDETATEWKDSAWAGRR